MKPILFICAISINLLSSYKDVTPPSIDGPYGLSYAYYHGVSKEDIIKQFIFEDNVDDVKNLEIYFSHELILDSPNHNFQTIYCKDTSGNIAHLTFDLDIYDDLPPKIYCPDNIIFNPLSSVDYQQIVDECYAIDDGDGRTKIEVINENYSSHIHQKGTYFISLKSSDNSNNTAYKTINITIKDDTNDIYFMNDITIKVSSYKYVNPYEMIDILKNNYFLENINCLNADYINSNYQNFYQAIGTYPTTLRLTINNQRMTILEIRINIVVTEEIEIINKKNESISLIEILLSILNYLKKLFQNIF